MPPLLKVPLERLPAHVHEVAADLARVLDPEAVQLVQPERDRLAVPAHRQLQRVVDFLIVFVGGAGVCGVLLLQLLRLLLFLLS